MAEQQNLKSLKQREDRTICIPYWSSRVVWDVFISALVIYTALSVPIMLGFEDAITDVPAMVLNFELVIDCMFIIDVGINMRTAFIEDTELVMDPKKIMTHYSRTWLAIDCLAAMPWEMIERMFGMTLNNGLPIFALPKVCKLPKMLRLGRLWKRVEQTFSNTAASVGQIIMLCAFMLIIVHWISCLWYSLSSGEGGWLEQQTFAEYTWNDQFFAVYYAGLMAVMGDALDAQTQREYCFLCIVTFIGACMNATM